MAHNKNSAEDFASERNILSFRPNITYVEPDQVDDEPFPVREPISTLDSLKTDATNLIVDYENIEKLCDEIQNQINNRSIKLVIQLDPNQDAHTLASIQRHFNDPNKTTITYEDYLECIQHLNEVGEENISSVSPEDITAGASDEYRENFGALGMPPGLSRPELNAANQSIKPLDLKSFQVEQLEKLLLLLTPGINGLIADKLKNIGGSLF